MKAVDFPVYKAGAQRGRGGGRWGSGADMSGSGPSTPASPTTTVRLTKGAAELLRETAERRGITMVQLLEELADAASSPNARPPAVARSPAAPSPAPPQREQNTSGRAVLSHAALEERPKAYDYFTGLGPGERDWLYPRLKAAVRQHLLVLWGRQCWPS